MANNHYETILLLNKPTESHTEEEVTIESPHPSTFEQAASLHDAEDVIDLTDDSEVTTQQSDSFQNNTSFNELQSPTHLFVNTAAEWMDDLPHDIDGFKLYKIKCSPQEWVQKSQVLRHFKMHSSRRKELIRRLEGALEICIVPLMIAHLSILQKENGTLLTFGMLLDTRFASAAAM